MPLIRFWCRLRECDVPWTTEIKDAFSMRVLDDTPTILDKIHNRHPAIIDWYGDPERFPDHLRYVRDTEPCTYDSLDDLITIIEAQRRWTYGSPEQAAAIEYAINHRPDYSDLTTYLIRHAQSTSGE